MVDWGVIEKYRKVFDTDEIDIGRRMTIINPDGSEGEILPDTPLYTGVRCHASLRVADNPDPAQIDTKPVVLSVRIDCDSSVDVQNNDYITLRKLASNGTVIDEYKGNASTPFSEQSGTSFYIDIRQNV